MIQFLVDKIHDSHFMTMLLAAIAVSATAYTLICRCSPARDWPSA